MPEPLDPEKIAEAIRDYFQDVHDGETAEWDGFTTSWLDTSTFDAMDLAERIADRLNDETKVLDLLKP